MNMRLKAFFALAAIAIALIPQAEAQNTNHTPVVACGLTFRGVSTVPDELNGVLAIAAGGYHSLALIAETIQKPSTLGAPQRMPDGSFRWMLLGEAGRNYTAQSSTNLTLWTDLQTVALGGSSVQITDTNASTYPRRFYRVRTQ